MPSSNDNFSFNSQNYEFIVKIQNGINTIQLAPEAFSDLYIEEDIFDWFVKGSIVIKTPYESLERSSAEAIQATGLPDTNLIYKFRADGRDTIYITIFPTNDVPAQSGLPNVTFDESLWRIELECVIYDVEDLTHSNITNKAKKLYFWEKTYQRMLEKNIEFTTATVGSNKTNTNIHKLTNNQRALQSGEALGQLLATDTDFSIYANNVNNTQLWNVGDPQNKIFYTSPSNSRFIDDMNYLMHVHCSSQSQTFQPCILKFERGKSKGQPKQFSLMSIKDYFKNAGVGSPGTYQIEHYFLSENSQTSTANTVPIIKAPISNSQSTSIDVKAEDFSTVENYQLVDFAGIDYATQLHNRFITSFNNQYGQFNIEIQQHKTEQLEGFFSDNIANQVLTTDDTDRLPLTNYILQGYNSEYVYSPFPLENNRIAEGRNKLLKYYMFSNIGISFSLRGMTMRQPGRFFGLSKNTQNIQDFDNKLEGQYFITNVVHYFSNEQHGYYTQITGIKMHIYQDMNPMQTDDVLLIT